MIETCHSSKGTCSGGAKKAQHEFLLMSVAGSSPVRNIMRALLAHRRKGLLPGPENQLGVVDGSGNAVTTSRGTLRCKKKIGAGSLATVASEGNFALRSGGEAFARPRGLGSLIIAGFVTQLLPKERAPTRSNVPVL